MSVKRKTKNQQSSEHLLNTSVEVKGYEKSIFCALASLAQQFLISNPGHGTATRAYQFWIEA